MIAAASPLAAQSSGPLVLLLPVSARPAALGNAWVAGRDEYAVFYNPAAASATSWVGATFGAYGDDAFSLSTTAGATFGPTTIAWGAQYATFSTPRAFTGYPFVPSDMFRGGDADNSTLLALVAARLTWKGFGIGAGAKYAEDIALRESPTSALISIPTRGSSLLLDLGSTHPLWTGTAGIALQNIAEPYTMGGRRVDVPTQLALGWTKTRTLGPLDFGFAGQATLRRHGWVGVGAGVDLGYSWIEGVSLGLRAGARRPETDDEKPVSIGASFTFDRFSVEYGLGFFAGDHTAHRITARIR